MKQRHAISIRGIVQGVGFRHYTRLKALDLGITGFVRNEGDGSVSIEAEGENPALKAFTLWCHNGPRRAEVRHIDIRSIPARDEAGFIIR